MKKLKKTVLASILGLSLLPVAAFGQTLYEEDWDAKYGPEDGSSVLVERSIEEASELSDIDLMNTYLWTANYQVTSHYQIPYDINTTSSESHVKYISTSSVNTGTNTTYRIVIERFNTFTARWSTVDSNTEVVGAKSTSGFYNLNPERHRLHIEGNVKGTMEVSRF